MDRCPECDQSGKAYCKACNSAHWKNNFANWTSGDSSIDELIQESQINASNDYEIIEWIPYDDLDQTTLFASGGFGSIYKSVWKSGPLSNYYVDGGVRPYHGSFWNSEKSEWNRLSDRVVAIKKINNQTSGFIREVTRQSVF